MVDLPNDQSVVAGGPARGASLHELLDLRGRDLLGSAALDGGRFPLLVKYIDACQTLSVQVHPDQEVAHRLGGRPKSEAWYIMDVAPGGAIYLGLEEGTTRDAMRQAIDGGAVEELLVRVEVRPGDLVPVPPGTVHAISEGVLLAEVQQPSDTTCTLYDWGRVGLSGKPRDLHVDQALEAIHFGEAPPPIQTLEDGGQGGRRGHGAVPDGGLPAVLRGEHVLRGPAVRGAGAGGGGGPGGGGKGGGRGARAGGVQEGGCGVGASWVPAVEGGVGGGVGEGDVGYVSGGSRREGGAGQIAQAAVRTTGNREQRTGNRE